MNRSSFTGRALALAGTSVVAIGASLALAAPASAHHSIVQGTCAAGAENTWTVTWTVRNSEANKPAKLKTVEFTPSGSTLTGIQVGSELTGGGKVTGTQVVSRTHRWAKLTVTSEWVDGTQEYGGPKTGSVELSETLCGGGPVNPPSNPPATPTTPPSAPATPEQPTPSVPAEPTLPPLPGEPDVDIVFTCDELQITTKNPANNPEFELTFTPSTGTAKTVKFPPGKTVVLKWPAKKGFVLTVSSKDWNGETVKIPWEEPKGCDNGEGGGLPVTGTAVGGIAGGAAVLLAIGAGLFVMSRRRRVRFTAE